MIEVSRINGDRIMVNQDHIRFVEKTPDTLITFSDDKKIMVRDTVEEIVKKIELSKTNGY
jgi:flagellar protein FlbD